APAAGACTRRPTSLTRRVTAGGAWSPRPRVEPEPPGLPTRLRGLAGKGVALPRSDHARAHGPRAGGHCLHQGRPQMDVGARLPDPAGTLSRHPDDVLDIRRDDPSRPGL